MDIIENLGEMALASRLKRFSERLYQDVSRIYRTLDVDFEDRWFLILYILAKQSPMNTTDLARASGRAHTVIKQLTIEMIKNELLKSTKDPKDERNRLISLSKKGHQVVAVLTKVWNEIGLCTKELISSSGNDLLLSINKVEKLLDEEDMYERVCSRLNIDVEKEIKIVEYCPAYKKHFKSINYEWLKEFSVVEKEDEILLSDPTGRIIKKGGAIIFATMGGDFVGTCALIKLSDEAYELTKMAVTPHARSRKIGTMLVKAMIKRAKALGAKSLYLKTHPKLILATRCFEKFGFKRNGTIPVDRTRYDRETHIMKLEFE